MLNSNGFDVWADGYDESVRLADESDAYPFAGYATILKEIYGRVCASGAKTVLDIGFGTGTLAAKDVYKRQLRTWARRRVSRWARAMGMGISSGVSSQA